MQMSSDEGCDSEAFFDPAECLSIEDFNVSDMVSSSVEYGVWLSEPQSVERRRKDFLLGMGLAEPVPPVFSSSDYCSGMDGDSLRIPGIERLTESSKAVSRTSFSVSDRVADCPAFSRNEVDNAGKPVIRDRDVDSQLALEGSFRRKDLLTDCATKREKQNNDFSFWKLLISKINSKRCVAKPRATSQGSRKIPNLSRIKAHHNKKRLLELSALFSGQDIQAHNGIIWTMKFSPDGLYLATGGEDGNICIWRVTSADASLQGIYGRPEIHSESKEEHLFCKGKTLNQVSVLKPDKIFWIDESPVQVLRGHTSGVLDLAWSSSNKLLSSSKDYTVRLWQVGCGLCQDVFHHSNYVTCIQFNPVDDDYFTSGSVDGKARVWRVSTRRVVDWADVQDVISAVCYRPHGKGFAVGTIAGACHFYETTGTQMQRDTMISIQSRRKKHFSNKITSIEFSKDISGRVLISSRDSKIRIFEGNDIIYQYKGPRKSGSQTSASFTSTGKYVVSIGDDSRVCLWDQSDYTAQHDGSSKSVPSCEYFWSEGASVVLPWCGNCTAGGANGAARRGYKKENGRFSLGKWFTQEGQCRTWPEELLPPWEETPEEDKPGTGGSGRTGYEGRAGPLSEIMGLVFVTGSRDGRIRTFHNYGSPVRL